MTQTAATAPPIRQTYSDDELVDTENSGVSRLAPLIILAAIIPSVVLYMFDPGALDASPLTLSVVLLPMLFISAAIYSYCVLNPGPVSGIVIDRATRTIELVESNIFAVRRTQIGFEDVANVEFRERYDDDGYTERRIAELVLTTGERFRLPDSTDARRLGTIRATLGLA